VRGRLARAMHDDARTFNRRQPRNGILSMRLDVKASAPVLIPIASTEPMRLRSQCETCGCRYSYIGAAFFCPSCGSNSAIETFGLPKSFHRFGRARFGMAVRSSVSTMMKLHQSSPCWSVNSCSSNKPWKRC
jgi:hypothetical protein